MQSAFFASWKTTCLESARSHEGYLRRGPRCCERLDSTFCASGRVVAERNWVTITFCAMLTLRIKETIAAGPGEARTRECRLFVSAISKAMHMREANVSN